GLTFMPVELEIECDVLHEMVINQQHTNYDPAADSEEILKF
nr:hypothetical protein [Tanacetum cinerariifolium]